MTLSSRIPVAVIGVGEHGKHHARILAEMPEAELAGVYDVNRERAQAVAAELGCRTFDSLDEALSSVRAVSVVIPTTDHARVAHQAFDAGVDVLLEKPITRTVDEAG